MSALHSLQIFFLLSVAYAAQYATWFWIELRDVQELKHVQRIFQLWLNCAFRVTLVAKSEAKCSMKTSATPRHIVSKLSGFYAFADEPQTLRMLWNRVSYVAGDPRKLSIALGWPEGERPHITFVDQKGWDSVGWVWLKWCSVKISKYGPEKIHWRCAPLLECYSPSQVVGSGGID